MVKQHVKRLASPNSWPILRRTAKWITRPYPGAHSFDDSLSIETLFKEVLGFAKTRKEVRHVLNSNEILVNGKRVKENKYLVGLFDVISIPLTGESYRLVLTKQRKLTPIKISQEDSLIKPAKIIGKTNLKKGILQLNLSDGRNIRHEGKEIYNVGDVVILKIPDCKIKDHVKMEKGVMIYLTAGKHAASMAVLEEINENKIIFKLETGESFETLKTYAFAVGKEKALFQLFEDQETAKKKAVKNKK